MTKLDDRLRELAGREEFDTSGGYEEKLRRTLSALPKRRSAVRRMALAAVVAALMLSGVAAVAAGMSGLVDFWNEMGMRTEGAAYVERPMAQSGDAIQNAVFTVREAVFDGGAFQAVVEVRSTKENYVLMNEDYDISEWNDNTPAADQEVLIAVCDVDNVEGVGVGNGILSSKREDGALLLYIYDTLSAPVDAQRAHVEMTCIAYPETDISAMERTTVAFDIDRVRAEQWRCGDTLSMGAFEILDTQVTYSPLSVDLTLTYLPDDRLRRAGFSSFLLNADGSHLEPLGGRQQGQTELDGLEALTGTWRFERPDTLPRSLRMGVEGLDRIAVFDLETGSAYIEEGLE